MNDMTEPLGAALSTVHSSTHLVLIPSYNPGRKVFETVQEARQQWSPVWVVVDGSTDGTAERLTALAALDEGLEVIVLPKNVGKGAAVLHGLEHAAAAGYTHVLAMDSDGQHPAGLIPQFMRTSALAPDAMVLGRPVFDKTAPLERVLFRKLSNGLTNLETLWAGIGDSLYGFRVYPVEPLRRVMAGKRGMRRFDFDPEVAVRLSWEGVRPISLSAPVRYFRPDEGGVSHFRYIRDNWLLMRMYFRLFAGFVLRLPRLLNQRHRQKAGARGPLL